MIKIITTEGLHCEFTDVYSLEITDDYLYIEYQHPNDDAYVYTFELWEVKYMVMIEPVTIKFNVGRSIK